MLRLQEEIGLTQIASKFPGQDAPIPSIGLFLFLWTQKVSSPPRGLGDMTPAIHNLFPHRFLRMQVGSAIISSEVWDITGDVNTAVTFHLQHQAQVLSGASGKQTTLYLYPGLVPPASNISSLENQGLKMFKENTIHNLFVFKGMENEVIY